MATVTLELRKLTHDWTNPDFDGRRRYGTNARRVLPAGTRLVIRSYEGRFGLERSAIVVGLAYSRIEVNNVDMILSLSVPVEPETWTEFRAVNNDIQESGFTNQRVLDILWQSAEMRPALQAAFAEAMKEDTEEDTAA